MILRVMASLIFFYLCVFISKEEKSKLKYNYEYLTGLINALKYLKKEIVFFSSYLSDALINASEYAGIANNLFEKWGMYLKDDSFTVLDSIFVQYLKIRDSRVKQILKEFSVQVGTSDTENEEILIDNTIMKLMEISDEYKSTYDEKGKLISRIGIIAGLFLGILIL